MAKRKEEVPGKLLNPKLVAVGQKLRRIRIERGYTNYDFFAWEHKLTPSQYLSMETGKNFKMESLLKVLEIYDMKVSDFFSDID